MSPAISNEEQVFLDQLDKKLWNAADRLRSNLDAAVYKHAVLGLIFLKYVSDSFDLRREELRASFADPDSEYYLDRADGDSDEACEAAIQAELEDRDYFTAKNVFWVPALARWENIRNHATLPAGTNIEIGNGKAAAYTFRSVGRLIDDALEAVERENPRLKGVLEKNRYSQLQLDAGKLIGLISEVISSIPFRHDSLNARDIPGHVYEYFLGQFALAEDSAKITHAFRTWRKGEGYEDEPGFCFSATLADVRKSDFVLAPGRYVGAADEEDDGEPFADKMARLTGLLGQQLETSKELEVKIRKNLGGLGFEF